MILAVTITLQIIAFLFVVRLDRAMVVRWSVDLDVWKKLPSFNKMAYHPKYWHLWTTKQWEEAHA